MNPHISIITIGVQDLDSAKRFYGERLGWPVKADHGGFVSFGSAEGSTALALYRWDALARDVGVDADSSGFRGVTFNYIVRSAERVDAVLAEAERAGGSIVKVAEDAPWGGRSGHFADPEGYLWKVAWSPDNQEAFSE